MGFSLKESFSFVHLRPMVAIVGPKDKNAYKDWVRVNTTTSSNSWTKELSPMLLGPVTMFNGLSSLTVENAWQYLKVYNTHLNDGEILPSYYSWARKGFKDSWAHRYPMGKDAIPEFSLWNGKRLDYIAARKKIYIPLYKQAVKKSSAYQKLLELYKKEKNIVLFDFDGYDYLSEGKTLKDVVNDPSKKMGHAFVLAMMLEEEVNGISTDF